MEGVINCERFELTALSAYFGLDRVSPEGEGVVKGPFVFVVLGTDAIFGIEYLRQSLDCPSLGHRLDLQRDEVFHYGFAAIGLAVIAPTCPPDGMLGVQKSLLELGVLLQVLALSLIHI